MFITINSQTKNVDPPSHLEQAIRTQLTFLNPRWIENQRMGLWQGNTPRYLHCYENDGQGGLTVPRGFTGRLLRMCHEAGKLPVFIDATRVLDPIKFHFHGRLRSYQEWAVDDIFSKRHGTLEAATGCGKTVIALAVIAKRRQPSLVIVHSHELLHQWVDRAEKFLGIPAEEIGIIGAGKKRIGNRLTVAMVQSLCKVAGEVAPHIGHLVVNECHRVPSRTFTLTVSAFDSRY